MAASSGFSFRYCSEIPKGIEPDLTYLHANVDKYQLIIRNYIVKELGKDTCLLFYLERIAWLSVTDHF